MAMEDEKVAYFLQLLHSRFVCLFPTQHIWTMTVAVLCVSVVGNRLLSSPERIVLLGDMLGKIGSNHLLDLGRGGLVHKGVGVVVVMGSIFFSSLPHTSRETVVVVAKQQSGVGIRANSIRDLVRMLRNGRAP